MASVTNAFLKQQLQQQVQKLRSLKKDRKIISSLKLTDIFYYEQKLDLLAQADLLIEKLELETNQLRSEIKFLHGRDWHKA